MNATISPKPLKNTHLPKQNEWNLNALFTSSQNAKSACEDTLQAAKNFNKHYQGKLSSIAPKDFERVLTQYEQLCENLGGVMTYAFLLFAKDTNNGALYADFEQRVNKAQNELLFFELELAKLDSTIIEQIANYAPRYAFYVQKISEQAKYTLSLKEEQVLLKTSPISANAFSRLFDEHLAQARFKCRGKKLNEEQILALLHNPDRITRKQAQKSFSAGLKKSRHLLSYILNIVRKDVAITKELRGYEKPESFRHIANCITQKSVDALVDCVNANYKVVHKYYTIKAKLMNIKTLKDYDRYAPLEFKYPKQKATLNYQSALGEVLESFSNFSPTFASIAYKAIKEGWVDSHPTPNKRGGAFSHSAIPRAHPYVLLNWTSNRRDTFTIAHEFGHMIHQELSKQVGYLNADTPLTTAETASVFAEMLLFDSMKQKLNKKELLELYAGKLEDIFSTLFRQIVMTNFERAIHAKDGELSAQDFDTIWEEQNAKMFGDSLQLTKNYAGWWCYIPHFIHSPFYCYAYSYGQLLVLALFGLYKMTQDNKAKREKFIQTYIGFLSRGGSLSPKELIKEFGFDIDDCAFWDIGMNEVKKMFSEFEELL